MLGLFAFFAFFSWLVLSGVPTEKDKAKAMILLTRSEARLIASQMEEQVVKLGGLTNINTQFVLNSLITTNKSQFLLVARTNVLGEVLDIWQTPYRIELVGPTNFIVRSAGKNQKFGDADDIIFNSASNDFVKP